MCCPRQSWAWGLPSLERGDGLPEGALPAAPCSSWGFADPSRGGGHTFLDPYAPQESGRNEAFLLQGWHPVRPISGSGFPQSFWGAKEATGVPSPELYSWLHLFSDPGGNPWTCASDPATRPGSPAVVRR